MWTCFMDMHSGGSLKEDWSRIYIEAPEDEAKIIFYNRFGHNPDRVTCTCCGEDYSTNSCETLEQVTGYDRGCKYDKKYLEEPNDKSSYSTYITLDEYIRSDDALFIRQNEITPEERMGNIPEQGYVWVD